MRITASKFPARHGRPVGRIDRHRATRTQHPICFPNFGAVVAKEVDDVGGEDRVDGFRRPREGVETRLLQLHAAVRDCTAIVPGGLGQHDGRMVDTEDMPGARQCNQPCNASARSEAQLENNIARSYCESIDCKPDGAAVDHRHNAANCASTNSRWVCQLMPDRPPDAVEKNGSAPENSERESGVRQILNASPVASSPEAPG